MALSMLVALTTCPALLATNEAVHQGQQKERREAHRARRCNLVATCLKRSKWTCEIDHRPVVLVDGRLIISTSSPPTTTSSTRVTPSPEPDHENAPEAATPHLCTGYFLPYPDSTHEGLVTSICDDPPIMNWIYIDSDTLEVKYGVRAAAQPHLTGPFDCTRQDRRLTLEGWEGFVAVQRADGNWGLYFDREDTGLKEKVAQGTPVLEVELWRAERRRRRGEAAS